MCGWGTKYVWVTLAGFQEGLNLGFHNMSLGTCRDSDANPRAQGLGTRPGETACSEKHSAKTLDLRLEVEETVQGDPVLTGFISSTSCPTVTLQALSTTERG